MGSAQSCHFLFHQLLHVTSSNFCFPFVVFFVLSFIQQADWLVQCSLHIQQADWLVQCSLHIQQADWLVQCSFHIQQADLLVQCSLHIQQADWLVQCSFHIQQADWLVQCSLHMLISIIAFTHDCTYMYVSRNLKFNDASHHLERGAFQICNERLCLGQ